MPRTLPFHSTKMGARPVFHNHSACVLGNSIEPRDWRPGDGNRPVCEVCARLHAAARPPRQAA